MFSEMVAIDGCWLRSLDQLKQFVAKLSMKQSLTVASIYFEAEVDDTLCFTPSIYGYKPFTDLLVNVSRHPASASDPQTEH